MLYSCLSATPYSNISAHEGRAYCGSTAHALRERFTCRYLGYARPSSYPSASAFSRLHARRTEPLPPPHTQFAFRPLPLPRCELAKRKPIRWLRGLRLRWAIPEFDCFSGMPFGIARSVCMRFTCRAFSAGAKVALLRRRRHPRLGLSSTRLRAWLNLCQILSLSCRAHSTGSNGTVPLRLTLRLPQQR